MRYEIDFYSPWLQQCGSLLSFLLESARSGLHIDFLRLEWPSAGIHFHDPSLNTIQNEGANAKVSIFIDRRGPPPVPFSLFALICSNFLTFLKTSWFFCGLVAKNDPPSPWLAYEATGLNEGRRWSPLGG